MAKAAAAYGATALLSNHSEFDDAFYKAHTAASRQGDEANPFDVGADAVARYFKVVQYLHRGCEASGDGTVTGAGAQRLLRESGRLGISLPDQRAVPDTAQERFQLRELPRSQFSAPLLLDIAKNVDYFRECGPSSSGKANDSLAALGRGRDPNDIAETFQAAEQLVYRLFADARALGQNARTDTVRTRKLKHSDMGKPQLIEARGIQPLDDAPVDGLSRNAQQGADQHVFRFHGRSRGC